MCYWSKQFGQNNFVNTVLSTTINLMTLSTFLSEWQQFQKMALGKFGISMVCGESLTIYGI